MKLNKENLLTILLVLLALVLILQAVQLNTINTAIKTGYVKVSDSSSTAGEGKTQLPTSLQNLPGMVGGC